VLGGRHCKLATKLEGDTGKTINPPPRRAVNGPHTKPPRLATKGQKTLKNARFSALLIRPQGQPPLKALNRVVDRAQKLRVKKRKRLKEANRTYGFELAYQHP
jgi:hypothetical protein